MSRKVFSSRFHPPNSAGPNIAGRKKGIDGGRTGERGRGLLVAPARKTMQPVYAIINHDNLKQKASVWFVSLEVLEATFCVGVKT